MRRAITGISLMLFIAFSTVDAARAAHPLITDDAGTVGKGSVQIELNYQYSHDKNEGVKEDEHEIETVLTYGLIDPLDLVITLPFLFTRSEEEGSRDREEGIGDMSFEVKWRFYSVQEKYFGT